MNNNIIKLILIFAFTFCSHTVFAQYEELSKQLGEQLKDCQKAKKEIAIKGTTIEIRITKIANDLRKQRETGIKVNTAVMDTMKLLQKDNYYMQLDTAYSHKALQSLTIDSIQQSILRDSLEKLLVISNIKKDSLYTVLITERAQNKDALAKKDRKIEGLNERISVLNLETEEAKHTYDTKVKELRDSIKQLEIENLDNIVTGRKDTLYFNGKMILEQSDNEFAVLYIPFNTSLSTIDVTVRPTNIENWYYELMRLKKMIWHYRGQYEFYLVATKSSDKGKDLAKQRLDAAKQFILTNNYNPYKFTTKDITTKYIDSSESANTPSATYVKVYIRKR
jgi:hypothetical protein